MVIIGSIMGCSSSLGTVIVNNIQSKPDTSNVPITVFDSKEKQIIRRTWRYLNGDLTERGSRVFLYIFNARPDLKVAFHLDDIPNEELHKNFIFIDHASRFMQAVGAVVENMDDLEGTLSPLLMKLGATHVGFDGFEVHDLPLFVEAIMEIWENDLGAAKFKLEHQNTWLKVFTYITSTLEQGYQKQRIKIENGGK